jgi:Mg-chelatase subunit ChlD
MIANDSTPRPTSRRRIVSYALLGAGALTVLAAVGTYRRGAIAGTPNKPVPAQNQQASRPRVDLVFALDTTGSMGGLLDGAKRKIWSLASFVARGQPTPELRVGLVAYRDVGDEYVTRVYDLDSDLDRVYARLQRFAANGGGDGPEHVARALHDAVYKMSWSGNQAVKVLYLVGDAPPHTDYNDGFDLAAAATAAAGKGIQVHTIRCGVDPTTEVAWRKVAELGHGEFLTIQQNGGMIRTHTPYDAELGRLHDELSGTAMGYGAAAPSVAATVHAAAEAPPEAKADRAAYMATKGGVISGEGDLVEDVLRGRVKLSAVPPAAMPPTLAATPAPERPARIEEIRKEREGLAKKIGAAAKARARYLEEKGESDDAFDAVAKKALKKSVNSNPKAGFKL